MRSHPSSWTKTLARLGFRRVRRRPKTRPDNGGRFNRLEQLEPRQMLSITVDTLADVVDANDGVISLREAIADAASHGNEVEFHSSLNGGSIALNSQLTISQSITITGPGADKLAIDAQNVGRVFQILPGVGLATISGVTITGGGAVQYGGGVFNNGNLVLSEVVITGNTAAVGGGGVHSDGPSLQIVDSTVSHNRAGWGAGVRGDLAGSEWIKIDRSTIAHNVADDGSPSTTNGAGGGIRVGLASASSTVNLQLINSTISNNVAEGATGGVHLLAGATASLRNSTITENIGGHTNGGLYNEGNAALSIQNSIVAANRIGVSDSNVSGSYTASASLLSGNPQLSPLGSYGGLTAVHYPLPGSPAIDQGLNANAGGIGLVDQLGSPRLIDDPNAADNSGNTVDIGAVEAVARVAVGDFNGDGREDELRYSPTLKSLLVAEKSSSGAGWEVGAWGSLALATQPSPYGNGMIVGDFNGDGRDDIMVLDVQDYSWLLGISDGTAFHVEELRPNGAAFTAGWAHAYVGDFDGDGDEELIGKTDGGTVWLVVQHDGTTGSSALKVVDLPSFTPGPAVFVQDANRDGRDDLITRTSVSAPWMVSLGGVAADGSIVFQQAADWNAWINYGYAAGKLDADKALAKVIEEFAWIYNNVELELYPGLMKGPEATEQAKAGNDWDQAALLEQRLQALPIFGASDVTIASGKVRVAVSELQNWLGVTSPSAAYRVIRAALDSNVTAYNTEGGLLGSPESIGSDAIFNAIAASVEFTHAWVRVNVPTSTGLSWVDLDPSWKFKDRQAGITVIDQLDQVHTAQGLFDEFSYLGLNPAIDRRLPIEFFEDQVMQWLASNATYQGSSLADVPHDGPIKTKLLETLPAGLSEGMSVAPASIVATYGSFAAIALNATLKNELTHRVRIRLLNGTTEHWSEDLVVPQYSLDTINITFASSFAGVSDPNPVATAGSTAFFGRLVIDGGVRQAAQSGESFSATDAVTIEVLHFAPTKVTKPTDLATNDPKYVGPQANDRRIRFSEKPGEIISIGLEANQHSHESLAELQASLLAAIAIDTTEAQLVQDIDLLVSYASAKYWFDYNRYNDAIAGLTGAIGVQAWVGSGIAKADPALLHANGSAVIDYLSFGMAPVNFGVDLPNSNFDTLRILDGGFHSEAWQLVGYNASALEHNIVEEIISAESVSTIKGLQRAYQKNLGLNSSGNLVSDDVIRVFESRVSGSTRTVYHVYDVRAGSGDIVPIGTDGVAVTESTFKSLLSSHSSATGIDDQLWDFFTQELLPTDGKVTVLASKHRTDVDNWTGAVYIADIPGRSMRFTIQPDGGTGSNGGFSGGVTTAPPRELQFGNFLNAGWAGDPVNVANGNMFRDETDIVFPNAGVPLTFTRHYDSQSKDDVGLGVGWTHAFGDLLYFDPKDPSDSQDVDAIVWLDAMGRRHRFEKLSDGTYKTPSGLTGKFTAISGVAINSGVIGFTFQDSSGMEYKFDKLDDPLDGVAETPNLMRHSDGSAVVIVGRLKEQVDRNGDGIAVKYTANSGRTIEHVRDVHKTAASPTRRLAFTYSDGVVTVVSKYDAGGLIATWNYGYGANLTVPGVPSAKRLRSVEAPLVAVANAAYVDGNARPKVQYGYNDIANHYARGVIDKITEPDGSWHAYEYYRNGRVFRVLQGEASESLAAPPAPTVDLSGFTGVGNTSAPNNYNVVGATIGGTFDARRSGIGEAAAYFADTSLAVPGGVLTGTTAGGFGATGTLTFDASIDNSSLVDPGWSFGFFDKDNLAAGTFGFVIGDNTLYAFRFLASAGTALSDGTVRAEGTRTFDLDVNNGESGAGYVRLRIFDGSNIVVDRSVAIGSTSLQADSFGFRQPYISTESDATFSFTISNVRYTGESLTQPIALDVPDAVDVQSFTYNIFRGQTEFTDERGNTETYFHQKNGLLSKQIHADRTHQRYTWGAIDSPEEFLMTSTVDERGAVETFTYYGGADPVFKHGQLKESTQKHFPNQTPLVTRYDYVQPEATKPHLVSPSTVVVDPGSTVADPGNGYYVGQSLTTTRQYYASGDSLGRLWKVTDSLGNVVEYTYYSNNEPAPNAHRSGLLKSIKQPAIAKADGAAGTVVYETIFDYDAAGNVKSTIVQDAAMQVTIATTQYVYDAMGNVIQTIGPFDLNTPGVVTESVYDVLGRLREAGFANSDAVIDPLDAFTGRFKYDAMGRVRESIDPLGRVIRFEYNRQGKVTRQINPDGTELLHEYDAVGNCIAKTDGLGRTTRFVYDSRNRLIQTIHPDGYSERIRYDGVSNAIATTDELGNVTTFKYDAVGRLLETKLPDPDGDGPSAPLTSPTTTNKYDKLGNLIEAIDPNGASTQFKHDKLGRVVETYTLNDVVGNRSISTRTPLPSNKTLVALSTTDYDAVGNVLRVAVYDVSKYDAANTTTLLANPRAAISSTNILNNLVQIVTSRYDAFGRPVKVLHAEGTAGESSTGTIYDAAGRVRFQYDELFRLTEHQYDQFGRLVATMLPDPVTGGVSPSRPTTTFRYDAAGNQVAMTDPRGFTTRYEYNVFNRRVATTDALGGRSRSVYDASGQMIAAIDALGRAAYTRYDERGRAILQRSADPDGPLPGRAAQTELRYDAAGRVIEKVNPQGDSTTYSYDRIGRLTSEHYVVAEVVDDAPGASSSFYISANTTRNVVVDEKAVGRDRTVLTGQGTTGLQTTAGWVFPNMPAGTYRVAITWSQPSASSMGYTVGVGTVRTDNDDFVTGAASYAGGVDQSKLPDDFVREEGGLLTRWHEAMSNYVLSPSKIPAGATGVDVHVRLIGGASSALQVDAVRLERIVENSFTYDANGNRLTETDALGRTTSYSFDELDRQTQVLLPDPGSSGVGGVLLPRPRYDTAYDGYGNVVSETKFNTGGTSRRVTAFEYDVRNRRTRETFDAGTDVSSNLYVNQRAEYQYDAAGNLLEERELSENAATPGTFDLQRRTTYQYDKLNRVTRETFNSDGNDASTTVNESVTTTAYDAAGNVAAEYVNPGGADPRQIATLYKYDGLGQVIAQTEQGVVGGATQKRTARFQYDAVGNQTAAIDPLGHLTRSEYDRLDRLAKSIEPDPDGAGSQAAHAMTFAYDVAGNLVAETNGAGQTDRFVYDARGLLVRSTDGRGDETVRRYDAVGNLVALVDPAQNTTTYKYDGVDRLTAETVVVDGAAKSRNREYDALGRLAFTTDRNGRATEYLYDRLDRVISEKWFVDRSTADLPNNADYSDAIGTIYDELGRVEERQYVHRTWNGTAYATAYRVTDSYQYDGLDRLTEHSNQSLASINHSTGPAARQIYAYGYDAAGLVQTREQFVGGQFAARTVSHYNAFDELVKVEDRDTRAGGVPSTTLDFEGVDAAFDYWADGSLKSASRYSDFDGALGGYRNEVKSDYGYDRAGRISSIAHQQRRRTTSTWPGYQPLVSFGYGYDNAGRINQQTTDWNTGLDAFSTRTDETQSFTYDLAGQLKTADSSLANRDADYNYNANGNRSSATEPAGGIDAYTTGIQNRVSQDSTYRYVYDLEGNVLERRLLSGDALDQRFTWDHNNRLVKVENFAGGSVEESVDYRYDSAGHLVYRSITPAGGSANVEHYIVENGVRTITIESDGNVVHRYQYGPGGQPLFDQFFFLFADPTSLQFQFGVAEPLGDHQNSTRVLMDHDFLEGNEIRVSKSFDYDPFGRISSIRGQYSDPLESSPGVPNAGPYDSFFLHHGDLWDAHSGLQLKGARWYSPDLGRFVSEDPLGYAGGDANLYRFVGNNPIIYVDPTGLYQQGHPLQGGSRAFDSAIRNLVTNPRPTPIAPTTTFQGFVGAGLGNQILSGGIGAAPAQTPAYNPVSFHGPVSSQNLFTPTIGEFSALRDYSSVTRLPQAESRVSSTLAFDPSARDRIVKIEQLGTGSPGGIFYEAAESYQEEVRRSGGYGNRFAANALNTLGFVFDLGPHSQPGQRVYRGDGSVEYRLGGDISDTSTAVVIPGAGAAGTQAPRAIRATREGLSAGAGKLKGWFDDAFRQADNVAPTPNAVVAHGHHPLPKFLGGNQGQTLSRLDPAVHREFHSLLGQNLKDAGIPLNVGGRGGSLRDWADYMRLNPGAQSKAFDAVLDASRSMDVKHGTNITQDVWRNIIDGSFEVRP